MTSKVKERYITTEQCLAGAIRQRHIHDTCRKLSEERSERLDRLLRRMHLMQRGPDYAMRVNNAEGSQIAIRATDHNKAKADQGSQVPPPVKGLHSLGLTPYQPYTTSNAA